LKRLSASPSAGEGAGALLPDEAGPLSALDLAAECLINDLLMKDVPGEAG